MDLLQFLELLQLEIVKLQMQTPEQLRSQYLTLAKLTEVLGWPFLQLIQTGSTEHSDRVAAALESIADSQRQILQKMPAGYQ